MFSSCWLHIVFQGLIESTTIFKDNAALFGVLASVGGAIWTFLSLQRQATPKRRGIKKAQASWQDVAPAAAIKTAICAVLMFTGVLGMKVVTNAINGHPSSCPITIANIYLERPYEIGKPLRVGVLVNIEKSGVRMAGTHAIAVGNDGDLRHHRTYQDVIWQKYEEFARGKPMELTTTIPGHMTNSIPDRRPLSKEDYDKLNDPDGFLYVAGQFDYGEGAIDYCMFMRPGRNNEVTLCDEHNGPVFCSVFNR